jgi:multiple sugar transport system permease protein
VTSRRGWLAALPLLLYLTILLAYPIAVASRIAVTDPLTGEEPSLASFRAIASDPLFRRALVNNAIVPLATVALEIAAALGLAVFLSRTMPARRLVRAAVVIPFALPEIVFLTMVRSMLTQRGYVNGTLAAIGAPAVDFLAPRSAAALASVIVVDAWRTTPIAFLVLLGALAAMPGEIAQAAELDGASAWRRFRWITLPLLRPALWAVVLIRGLDALRIFAAPLLLTGAEGVPVLSTYAFHQWSDQGDDGASAAAAGVLALLAVAASVPLLRRRAAEAA